MKRTLKRELKVRETVERKANGVSNLPCHTQLLAPRHIEVEVDANQITQKVQLPLQILVVVENIQMRSLKTEVEKGSM